jgi:hypothetical protein
MKKLIIVLVLLLAATALFGQALSLKGFPVGKWLDSNKELDYEAIWDFSSGGLKILNTDGSIAWDFAGKTIQDYSADVDGLQPSIKFTCPDAGRTYTFKALLPGNNVQMTIERDGLPTYTVTMPKQ